MVIFLSLIMFILPPSVLLSHHLGQLHHPLLTYTPAAIHSRSLPTYPPLQGPHTQLNSRGSPFMCFSSMHSICGLKTSYLLDVMFHELQKVKIKNTTNLPPDQATIVTRPLTFSKRTYLENY